MPVYFGLTLATIKMLDARRRGVTTEAYEQYAAGLWPVGPTPRRGGVTEGNAADDTLMVGQGLRSQSVERNLPSCLSPYKAVSV